MLFRIFFSLFFDSKYLFFFLFENYCRIEEYRFTAFFLVLNWIIFAQEKYNDNQRGYRSKSILFQLCFVRLLPLMISVPQSLAARTHEIFIKKILIKNIEPESSMQSRRSCGDRSPSSMQRIIRLSLIACILCVCWRRRAENAKWTRKFVFSCCVRSSVSWHQRQPPPSDPADGAQYALCSFTLVLSQNVVSVRLMKIRNVK